MIVRLLEFRVPTRVIQLGLFGLTLTRLCIADESATRGEKFTGLMDRPGFHNRGDAEMVEKDRLCRLLQSLP